MDKDNTIKRLNTNRPEFLNLLNCKILDLNLELGTCDMLFDIDKQFCHSVDVIQGGFVTAMLDSVSSHAVFAKNKDILGLSTLELKVSFLKASRAGRIKAKGKIEKLGKNIAFLSAELFNEDNIRTATLTATAMVSHK